MSEIYLDAPNIGEKEKEYLCRCVDSTFVSTVGPFVPDFEEKFAQYIGTKYAISTQSGTAAIHLSLIELGIGPGDEVIVPVTTFIATVNPIVYVGATPIFVDIDVNTWNIDPVEIRKAITNKTKAIIPVHLYGNPCDMDAIMALSKEFNIPVIEDATESLGATYKGKKTGAFGKFAAFSFNGNKVITTGGGGMITTNDKKAYEHIKFLVNQARDTSKGYYHPEIGYNYRMTNLEASMGLAQLERLPEFLKKKREFKEFYQSVFENTSEIVLQKEYEKSNSSWWMSSILINTGKQITDIQKQLKENGVPSRRVFIPIVEFPPYQKYKIGNYKNAYSIYEHGLNLPSSTLNTHQDLEMGFQGVANAFKA